MSQSSLLDHLQGMQTYTVTRNVRLSRNDDPVQEFELVPFKVLATSGAEACSIANDLKFFREQETHTLPVFGRPERGRG